MRSRFKKILLVAPVTFSEQLLTEHKQVRHISNVNHIFPAIHELVPDLIIFDFDFMSKDMESVLRRIKVNKFYSKTKICCYKNQPNEKIDDLLKALGVDQFFYKAEMASIPQKNKSVLSGINHVLDVAILKWVLSISQ